MNSFVVIAAALSMMVVMATSSPCNEVCMGSCTLAKQNCDSADRLCNVAFTQCAAVCDVLCGCDDVWETQCTPDFTACKDGAAGNSSMLVQCSANYDACIVQCQAGFQTAVNTVGSVIGGGAAK